jgi:hypothetical protein
MSKSYVHKATRTSWFKKENKMKILWVMINVLVWQITAFLVIWFIVSNAWKH